MKRILTIGVLILLAVACDALRDCWSCGRAGYWQWHLVKWAATYPLYIAVLWAWLPLFEPSRLDAFGWPCKYPILEHWIIWLILIIAASVVWTLTARHIGGQPTWGGILGIW